MIQHLPQGLIKHFLHLIAYEKSKEDFSYSIEYNFRNNFIIGIASERGNYSSIKFIYKNNPLGKSKKYKKKNLPK